MHALEYMILQLATRIENETGNRQLAQDARMLASATHDAFGDTDSKSFTELYRRWHQQHYSVLHPKSTA